MRACFLLLFSVALLPGQNADEEFRVYTDHPRLFLKAQHLRLLKRERERQSMRWLQFETIVKGAAQMPEPGFAYSLYYAVTGDAAFGKRAVEWAMGAAADARQVAIVFDWCQPLLTPEQGKALASKLVSASQLAKSDDVRAVRTRTLAAIAVSERLPDGGEAVMRDVVQSWWRKKISAALAEGRDFAPGDEELALMELAHAVRDNLTIDFRDSAGDYFKQLPSFYVSSHYPAPYAGPENEYRIPFYKNAGQPDLDRAAASRAAGLMMVAYDTNATENQFVQGWLMQDRFLLKGPYGCPYEYMWANPYQPGLSYFHLPMAFYDKRSGALFVRSDWEEDATWFGMFQDEMQVFRDGRITVLHASDSGAGAIPTYAVGDVATIVLGRPKARFQAQGGAVFVVHLKPRHTYEVEVDDEEMAELETDLAGTLYLPMPKEHTPGIRIREKNQTSWMRLNANM